MIKTVLQRLSLLTVCFLVMGAGLISAEATGDVPPMTGLNLWLKADSGVTESVFSEVKVIDSWESANMSGITFAQPTNNKKPKVVQNQINGYPAVNFSSKYLGATLAAEKETYYSIHMVMKYPEAGSFFSTMDTSSTSTLALGQFFIQRTTDNALTLTYKKDASANDNLKIVLSGEEWSGYGILSMIYTVESDSNARLRVYVNGNETSNSPFSTSTLINTKKFKYYGFGARNFAGSNHSNCEIAEVLVYHNGQTTDEVAAVHEYLQTKYFEPYTHYSFTGAQGGPADVLTGGGSVTITSTVQPPDLGQEKVTMISALYKKNGEFNELVKISFDDRLSDDINEPLICTISDLPEDVSPDKYILKSFFWENTTELKPLMGPVIYEQ